jgi:hypothetical protein
VELLRFEGEDLSPDRDGSITKSIVVAGEKANCPVEHAPIKGLNYKIINNIKLMFSSCCWFGFEWPCFL